MTEVPPALFRAFADLEAHAVSPSYERLVRYVATREQEWLIRSYTQVGVSHAGPPDRIPTRPGDAEVKGIRILGTTGLIVRSAGAVWRGSARRP